MPTATPLPAAEPTAVLLATTSASSASAAILAMTALTAAELQHALDRQLSAEWYFKDCKLQRDWHVAAEASTDADSVGTAQNSSSFAPAADFVEQLLRVAKQHQHHLDVQLSQHQHICVALYSTADPDVTITEQDIQLAVAIDILQQPPLSKKHRTRAQVKLDGEQQQAAKAKDQWEPILIDLPAYMLTPRLKLRPFRPAGDGPMHHEFITASLAEFQPHMHWLRHPPTVERCEAATRQMYSQWVARSNLSFVVLDRRTGAMVARASLYRINWNADNAVSCDIGYSVHSKHLGRGYATEAANAVARFAHKYFVTAKKPVRVEVWVTETNTASRKAAERLNCQMTKVIPVPSWADAPDEPLCVYVVDPNRLPPLEVEYVDE